jgi:thiol-disulfide isomerase/thioredoxin
MIKLNQLIVGAVLSLLISQTAMALSVGDTAPQIIGRDISNQLFALTHLANKPKVINFFWVECKPCQKELPLLAKKEAKNSKVIFSAIHAEINQSTGSNYNIEDIQAFSKTLKAHPKSMVLGSERIKKQFGIMGFPATVLLSAENKVEKILYGFNNKTVKQLETWLNKQK